jgi:hypothetical protein
MEILRRIWQSVRNLCAGAPGTAASADGRAQAPSPQEAAQEAAQEIFATCHSYQQQVRFAEVEPEDVVGEKAQDFYREGHGFQEVHTETRVVTTPGIIVPPGAITLKCSHCGGYDSETHLCKCGRGLCRLCKRELTMPDGKVQTFCPEHYKLALDRWDAWRAHDERRTA